MQVSIWFIKSYSSHWINILTLLSQWTDDQSYLQELHYLSIHPSVYSSHIHKVLFAPKKLLFEWHVLSISATFASCITHLDWIFPVLGTLWRVSFRDSRSSIVHRVEFWRRQRVIHILSFLSHLQASVVSTPHFISGVDLNLPEFARSR